MADMLVKLYDLPENDTEYALMQEGILIKKAVIIDKDRILTFIREQFINESSWAYECEYALFHDPVSCYIAVKDKQIIGFACYDATAKGFFGPTGVACAFRGKGVGTALLMRTLYGMKEFGYAYAVIGWPAAGAIQFYKNKVNAVEISGGEPNKSIYQNMISG